MSKQVQPNTPATDLTLPQNCLCGALSRALRAVRKDYDAALKTCGVTSAQFSILTTLGLTGEVPISKLATIMGTDRTTLTRNIAPLVQRGLVENFGHADQRIRGLGLTEAGHGVHSQALQGWSRAQGRLVGALGPDVAKSLLEKLNTIH